MYTNESNIRKSVSQTGEHLSLCIPTFTCENMLITGAAPHVDKLENYLNSYSIRGENNPLHQNVLLNISHLNAVLTSCKQILGLCMEVQAGDLSLRVMLLDLRRGASLTKQTGLTFPWRKAISRGSFFSQSDVQNQLWSSVRRNHFHTLLLILD